MKYQVLARKYRPKTFMTMMGQEHVLKALTNALNTGRLHHAYLFTGTRGVGKTTVARVLAKALNCEQGISASPCGQCTTCQEIDQGRFIDLIEVDAASKTKVEDTRELLDNVQYAPTSGRFKIYLIDEVHMLSNHSFNALLKTLEEPPPHAKFLLATTDPQKLPVTILSRCLQFNLKSLSIEQIEQQLTIILEAEQIAFSEAILKPLAVAADGSMRDALSLLDQAIAYSDGKPNLPDIEAMLGCVQKDRVFDLLAALANGQGAQLIEQSRLLAGQGIDANVVLAEIIEGLQRIALFQLVPDALDDSLGDRKGIERIARVCCPADIQLFYQIALNGRKDLPYSPQPQGGFEMILLRMLAFRPDTGDNDDAPVKKKIKPQRKENDAVDKLTSAEQNESLSTPSDNMIIADDLELPPIDAYAQDNNIDISDKDNLIPYQPSEMNKEDFAIGSTPLGHQQEVHESVVNIAPIAETKEINLMAESLANSRPPAANKQVLQLDTINANKLSAGSIVKAKLKERENVVALFEHQQKDKIPYEQDNDKLADEWQQLINRSTLDGLEQQLAKHCALVRKTAEQDIEVFELLLQSVHSHLLNDKISTRLQAVLQDLLGKPVTLQISECQLPQKEILDTPRRREIHDAEIFQQQAIESIMNDPGVQQIVNAFAAKVHIESIKPIS